MSMISLENIDGVLVNRDIVETKFTCDLKACKGACCTMKSEYGAPLNSKEIKTIEQHLPIITQYLSEFSTKEIDSSGFWEKKEDELMTKSLGDTDCVFVFYEDDVAKCSIEKAYNDGKIDFIKPISCHLFPIRISDFGGDVLRYESYKDCDPALENGEKTGLSVLEFCEKPIKRAYNSNFFNKLEKLNGN